MRLGVYAVHCGFNPITGQCLLRTFPKQPPKSEVELVGQFLVELENQASMWLVDSTRPDEKVSEWLLDLRGLDMRAVIDGEERVIRHEWSSDEERLLHFESALA